MPSDFSRNSGGCVGIGVANQRILREPHAVGNGIALMFFQVMGAGVQFKLLLHPRMIPLQLENRLHTALPFLHH
jgi:hypothetical protein